MNNYQISVADYQVYLAKGILNHKINDYFYDKEYFLCIDANVYDLHHDLLKPIIKKANAYVVLQALEEFKNEQSLEKIYQMLYENKASRSSTLLVIGGGLIGDVAGYAAATYNRGIDFVFCPTTLLSMVDSSIGGKVAINKYNLKNIIGTFYNPKQVIIDLDFLSTLSTRLFKEGFVELLKHGFIADISILDQLMLVDNIFELRENDALLIELINKSLLVKKTYVESDSHDQGLRHVLNFGHTFAHAIEMSNHGYFHGECVAIGMLLSAALNNDGFENDYFKLIKQTLEKFECLRPLKSVDFNKINYDKKKNDKGIKEVVLTKLAQPEVVLYPTDQLIEMYTNIYKELKDFTFGIEPIFCIKNQPLKGEVVIPPSKSYLHRYLMLSFLHAKKVVLNNVSELSDDVLVTIKILEQLGSKIIFQDQKLYLDNSKIKQVDYLHAQMQESGTSLRLMLPWLNHFASKVKFEGVNQLPKRPLDDYINIITSLKIDYELNSLSNQYLPLTINDKIDSERFIIENNVSSQYISGLLLLMSILEHDCTLQLLQKPQSLPYIKMTLAVLAKFNIEVEVNDDYTKYFIKGKKRKIIEQELNFDIEQDYSSRSFFEVARSFKNNDIMIKNPLQDTLQGDSAIIDSINNQDKLFDLTNQVDNAIIMALYYAVNGGTLQNVERLKYKESNRLNAIMEMLDKMQINYELKDNDLIISPSIIHGAYFNTFKDHRVSMTLCIASSVATSNVYVNEIKSINKSFVSFIDKFRKLGGCVDEQ